MPRAFVRYLGTFRESKLLGSSGSVVLWVFFKAVRTRYCSKQKCLIGLTLELWSSIQFSNRSLSCGFSDLHVLELEFEAAS